MGTFFHHHDIVAHTRRVGTTGGTGPEHNRDRRDAGGRELGDVLEPCATRHKYLALPRQVGSGRFGERNVRQSIEFGDLHAPSRLRQRPRITGTALHRHVGAVDHAFDTIDLADCVYRARSNGVIGSVGRERVEFDERRVGIDKQLNTFTYQHLAALTMAIDVSLATCSECRCLCGQELIEQRLHGRPIGLIFRRAGVDAGTENSHLVTVGAIVSRGQTRALPVGIRAGSDLSGPAQFFAVEPGRVEPNGEVNVERCSRLTQE